MRNDDFQGEVKTPRYIEEHLLRRGGKNPYDEPLYRLIWAPTRVIKQGGRWHDWDENIPVTERGGVSINFENGIAVPRMNRPYRVVEEVRLTRKYAFDGWVLERWVPSIMYPRSEYERTVPGTTIPLLGPYPERGEYEMVAGGPEYTEIPSLSSLDFAIDQCEAQRARHRISVEYEVLARVSKAMDEYERQREKEYNELLQKMRENKSILFGTSLEAGRIRNEIAKSAGVTEHVGN
jgi:hypothetical protein